MKNKYCLVKVKSNFGINNNYPNTGTCFYVTYISEEEYLFKLKKEVTGFYQNNMWITQNNYYKQEILSLFNQYCKLEKEKFFGKISVLFIKYKNFNKYKILTTDDLFNDYLIQIKNNKYIKFRTKHNKNRLKSHTVVSYGRNNKMGKSILKNNLKIQNDYLPLNKDYYIRHQNRRKKDKIYDFTNYDLIHSRKSTGWKSHKKKYQWQ